MPIFHTGMESLLHAREDRLTQDASLSSRKWAWLHRELKESCGAGVLQRLGSDKQKAEEGLCLEPNMNRMMKLALSTLLGVALVVPAFAQDQFPDVVPDSHWAYDAVANLKGKVVIGYPDGKYRGAREMTRYEFAVAIDRLWKTL